MKKLTPFLLAILFLVLHVWALMMLWTYGPSGRQAILVVVYTTLLAGSAWLTKRFPPPVLASLLPFAVVLGWRIWVDPGHWWS